MAPRRPVPAPEPPCPACTRCGQPAACEVTLEVRQLVLDRDAGVRSQAYWTPSYRTPRLRVAGLFCEECCRSEVRTSVSVDARLVGKEGS